MASVREEDQLSDVCLDPGLAETLLSYLEEGRGRERGGVLLGSRGGEKVSIGGAVFPPQLAEATDHCAFDVSCIDTIRQAMTSLESPEIKRIAGTIVGWVHSHPGHGLFLSRTDRETFAAWIQLDDKAIAMVADPFLRRRPDQRIAWWHKERQGRHVAFEDLGSDVMTLRAASGVAEAISDTARDGRVWDVLAPRCIIRLFPAAGAPAARITSSEPDHPE